MENSRFTRSMLLDFYGELLTDKQRECFDLHYNEDISLAEIAEQLGVSRQGVWDNIRRAETAMEDIEAKTGLLRRFEENRRELESLLTRLEALTGMTQGEAQDAAKAAAHTTMSTPRRISSFFALFICASF